MMNSRAHGLVDPTPTATISLCAFSAVMFLLFFILAGYNYGPGFGNYFFPQDLSLKYAPMNLAAAILGVSLGLIASVVRYRYPIASTFAVVTLAPFLGLGLLLSIGPALAGGENFSRAITSAVLQLFLYFCIFVIAFSSCAVGGCIVGHIIQERSKPRVARPEFPSLVTLAIGITGCTAALTGAFWPRWWQ
jgi:hypothetical protein